MTRWMGEGRGDYYFLSLENARARDSSGFRLDDDRSEC